MTATTTALCSPANAEWAQIAARAPKLAVTSARYLEQIALSLRPTSVEVAELALRSFCRHLIEHHPRTESFRAVGRLHIESYKVHLASAGTTRGRPPATNTRLSRLRMLRAFFDRIIEWEWDDAPPRCPIFSGDLPRPDEPLPKFLDDSDAAKLARAVAAEPDSLRRLVLELLMRTGIRASELCALEADAVVEIGNSFWLRVPVGKLHNDRYVPLHPTLLPLLAEWKAQHPDTGMGLLLSHRGAPLDRHQVARMVAKVGRRAGVENLHPHRLRHTLGTQAINRGMRLEAVAALLGHRTLTMAARYGRIANKTVAAEYQSVSEKVEALYAEPPQATATGETPAMRRLRAEHHRMLANGWCTRPAELDCSFEAICEGCGFFATTVEFKNTLTAQRDHAATHGQKARQRVYDELLDGLGGAS